MTGLLEGLAIAAAERPDAAATLLPTGRRLRRAGGYRATTFRQLDERSALLANGLVALGLGDGARVALLVPPGDDFFALSFALLRAGSVPVLVDPGIGARRVGSCLAEAAPRAFVGSPKARLAKRLLRWAPDARTHTVARLARAGARHQEDGGAAPVPVGAGATAAVAFTTGSTGPPKGVEYRHDHFAAQLRALSTLYDLRPGQVSVATFPPFALFGPALGLTTVVPRMDPTRPASADPRVIVDAAAAFDAAVLFGSPTLLATLGRHGAATGTTLPTLRTVVSAGAPVPEPVIRSVVAMLGDGGRVVTPYGATEALPVTSIDSNELAELGGHPRRGVCVGRPAPGVDVVVIPVGDRPLATLPDPVPAGVIGEVVVRGPVVTDSYLARPDAVAMAKTDWDGHLAHRMGDLGWLDDDGRLWFCGRVAHLVTTATETLHPLPCELVFAAHPDVARAALVGIGPAGAQVPVLCVEVVAGARPGPRLTDELLALGAAHPASRHVGTIRYHPGFPVDARHNAKVGYEELARWVGGTLGPSSTAAVR